MYLTKAARKSSQLS